MNYNSTYILNSGSISANVNSFPGADLGEKIIAADNALGLLPGTIIIPDGYHIWTTHMPSPGLHDNRCLQFGVGIIYCVGNGGEDYPGPMCWLGNNSLVIGSGMGTVFNEPDSNAIFYAPGDRCDMKNFCIENLANADPGGDGLGASIANLGFGDGSNGSVSGVYFKNTTSLTVSIGGDGEGGLFANNIDVYNCVIDGCKNISMAAVNARNFKYHHNIFKNVGSTGPNAPYLDINCIDLEPNSGNDHMINFMISDNIFDLSNNQGGSGITVQGPLIGHNGIIANNIFIGSAVGTPGPSGAIGVSGTADVIIQGNNMTGSFSQVPIELTETTRISFVNNKVRSSGGPDSGFRTMVIQSGCVDTIVSGNSFAVPVTDQGWASINETSDCVNTYVYGNILISDGYNAGDNPFATIALAGHNSKAWLNVIDGYLQDGYIGIINGGQLTAATTITPTQKLHHVTGGTSISTIATTNFTSINGTINNIELTLVADGGTITFVIGGNIASVVTIAQNTKHTFMYDAGSSLWYP